MNKKHLFILIIAIIMLLSFAAETQLVAAQSSTPCYFRTGKVTFMGPCTNPTGVMKWENIIPSYGWSGFGAASPSSCCKSCMRGEFIRDVTIPDGSYIAPGGAFVKTWRIRNMSPSNWDAGTQLVFYSGSQMGAPASVPFPNAVNVGEYVNVSVTFQAPVTGGTYQSNWMIQTPDNVRFGVGCDGTVPLYVLISTSGPLHGYIPYSYSAPLPWGTTSCGTTNCSTINPCASGSCYTASSSSVKDLPHNPNCNNIVRNVNDITVPDGTKFSPNTAFRKTWSMKNGGTCVWTEDYSLVFTGGDGMGSAQTVQMPHRVYPGETVTISIDLKSPEHSGNYRGYYMLRDNLGFTFGYGSNANSAFWVDIKVVDPAAAPAPAPVAPPPASPAPAAPGTNPAPPAPSASSTSNLTEIDQPLLMDEDSDPNYGADALEPNEGIKSLPHNECGNQHLEVTFVQPDVYNINWYVTNTGLKTWNPEKYRIVNSGISNNLVLIGADVALPVTKTNEQAMISISAKVRNLEDKSEKWLKFYLNDGVESFCEVYFPIPAN